MTGLSLLDRTRDLVQRSVAGPYAGTDQQGRLEGVLARLDEPLRVAIAGRVKAGKSTLLNALVGDRLAPTDAGECTRIVTWYADGHTYDVRAEPRAGATRQLRFERRNGVLEIDLDGLDPDQVERLRVTWPAQGLRHTILIDTPGIGSLSAQTSQRAWDALVPGDDTDQVADVVIYLLRHLHAGDVDFLRAFGETGIAQPSPINAIAVLSRADEIGAGRLDALASARRVAARVATEPDVRRLVQDVVPVAGLLAETAATLTQAEFDQIAGIAALDKVTTDRLLLSVDRFVTSVPEWELGAEDRRRLLDRFGLFGIRLASTMVRHRVATGAPDLATELLGRSGVQELRASLDTLFLRRHEVFKCRSALLTLDAVTRTRPVPGSEEVAAEAEQIVASVHGFRELRVLAAIRAGWITGRPDALEEAERLVGGRGTTPAERLGADPAADDAALRAEALVVLERWQRRAESPMTPHQLGAAARIVIQSCEGMVAELSDWPS